MNKIFAGDLRSNLIKKRHQFIFYSSLFFCCLFFFPFLSHSAEIIGPETKITNNEIYVTTGITLNEEQIQDLKNGISKEITFYIDLFRIWRMWPDEFVLGQIIVKALRVDPVKKEYVATSLDGMILTEKRFSELDSLLRWALNIKDLKLTNIRALEPDDYFIRITVESRLRRLPPVLSYLFFFVPDTEFKKTKDSSSFHIRKVK